MISREGYLVEEPVHDVPLRNVRALVTCRRHFYSRCGYVYGQLWHGGKLYAVFGIGMHRPMFIHLDGKWYALDISDEQSRYAKWMYQAACPIWPGWPGSFEKVLSCSDMQYLLHHCDVPPPPGIKRLLAVSPES